MSGGAGQSRAQPPTLGQSAGHVRSDSFQPTSPQHMPENQQQPPPNLEPEWSRGGAPGQRPVSSNQQHERSFSSASMLNNSGPSASQAPYNNRNSMGPGGLLQLQQNTAGSRFSSQGAPQLGALAFQDSTTPPQVSQDPMENLSIRDEPPPPQYGSQGPTPGRQPSPPRASASARPVFGISLQRLYERDGLAVPMVVYQCIRAVELYGLNVEGIYRLSGSLASVNKLKSMFDTGKLFILVGNTSTPFFLLTKITRYDVPSTRFQESRKLLPRCQQCGRTLEAVLQGSARPASHQRILWSIHRCS